MPAGERWRFTNSGPEAVMITIRAARAATGRPAILRFAGAYHGSYDAVVAADAPGVVTDSVEVTVGDEDALLAALDAHEHRLARGPAPGVRGLRRAGAARDRAPRDPADRRRGADLPGCARRSGRSPAKAGP
jgi:hypothetical protein